MNGVIIILNIIITDIWNDNLPQYYKMRNHDVSVEMLCFNF